MREPTVTSAKIILDSVGPTGARITTLQLVYPRFIHAEAKTHRIMNIGDNAYDLLEETGIMDCKALSRNASSSRAIPVAKMIEQVRNDPAMPIHWGANRPGMSAGEEIGLEAKADAISLWEQAAVIAANIASAMSDDLGLHKQVANRILEPFQWMHVIITATGDAWPDFFKLRLHDAADPNIFELARVMKVALDESSPVKREDHIPYVMNAPDLCDSHMFDIEDQRLISAGRCARVSYLNHDGSSPDPIKDIALARMLQSSGHASPFEHVATVAKLGAGFRYANFKGWQSLRNKIGI